MKRIKSEKKIIILIALFGLTVKVYAGLFDEVQNGACSSDYYAHCQSVAKGKGRILKCLKEKQANLKPECQEWLISIDSMKPESTVKNQSEKTLYEKWNERIDSAMMGSQPPKIAPTPNSPLPLDSFLQNHQPKTECTDWNRHIISECSGR